MSIYTERRSFNMTYTSLYEGGKCMVFERGDKEYRIPISQMIIIKDRRPAFDLKAGDIVSVMIPTWLAEKLGLVDQAHQAPPETQRYRGSRRPRRQNNRRKAL